MGFVPDKGHNHAVEIEEEHDQMEAQFDERFLTMTLAMLIQPLGYTGSVCMPPHIQGVRIRARVMRTFLCTFSFLKISVASKRCWFSKILYTVSFTLPHATAIIHILLSIPSQQRQIQHERNPVPVDQEQEGQKCVDGGFRDNVGVEAVAEVDGVDIVTGAKLALRSKGSGVQRGCRTRGTFSHKDTGKTALHSPFQIAVHDGEEDL
jgi:hypothetical protein